MADYNKLMEMAKEASTNAYCKYSNFKVGACVLTTSGKTFKGCNFENSSYGLAICAERCAVGAAIVNGESKIDAIAIYSPNTDNCYPCGACRQVMAELLPRNTIIYLANLKGEIKECSIDELLPYSFSGDDL